MFPPPENTTFGSTADDPVYDRITVDTLRPADPRFVVPAILGNSVGLAAFAERDGDWVLLPFETLYQTLDYGYDMTVDGNGDITWADNDCIPNCADGTTIIYDVVGLTDGYRVGPATNAPTSQAADLIPGQPCTPGSSPDCVDQYDDGTYLYIVGFADCVAASGLCTDLDGDGYAGYGDSG